jgi:hypothetical protein
MRSDPLTGFVVRAKAATYAGSGRAAPPSRSMSHDLCFEDDDFAYRDSYFGGTDFIGQEVVLRTGTPVWAMNYYGRILHDDLIDAARAGAVIKASLSAQYRTGRFLGGFAARNSDYDYVDDNVGDTGSFTGQERISLGATEVYRLDYHGGLIRD